MVIVYFLLFGQLFSYSGRILYFSLDNSDWMRNGDYAPSRFEAQQDAGNYPIIIMFDVIDSLL